MAFPSGQAEVGSCPHDAPGQDRCALPLLSLLENLIPPIPSEFVLLQAADYDDALAYFHKHDVKVIFWGRFVPGVRSLILLPAGVARMPFGRFALYALLGTALWNAALLMAGWFLGERWQLVLDVVDRLEFVAWGLLAAAVVAWVVWRRGEGAAAEPQVVT